MWLPLLALGATGAAGVLGAKVAAIAKRLRQSQARPYLADGATRHRRRLQLADGTAFVSVPAS